VIPLRKYVNASPKSSPKERTSKYIRKVLIPSPLEREGQATLTLTTPHFPRVGYAETYLLVEF
jgi:hypothetical protein